MTEQLGMFPPGPFDPNRPGPFEQLSPFYQPGIVPPTPGTAEYRQLQLWVQQQDDLTAAGNAQRQWAAYQASGGVTRPTGAASDPVAAVRQQLLLQNP